MLNADLLGRYYYIIKILFKCNKVHLGHKIDVLGRLSDFQTCHVLYSQTARFTIFRF